MKKSAGTKGKKATGIVMATRATLELHRSAVSAAKTAGESLGELMLRGISMAIAARKKASKVTAPKKAAKVAKPGTVVAVVKPAKVVKRVAAPEPQK